MKKYIKISSQGIIDPQAFVLIGASTKRADNSKIGFFGSGLKYSISYLLRNKINFKVFAEYNEITFTTDDTKFRDQDFAVIVVNGEKTSMTTEMGMDWEAWFIIREIYCNALDEGECNIDLTDHCVPLEGKTVFYIEINDEFQKIIDEWDNFFSLNRKNVVFELNNCRLFPGGNKLIVYRKGIRCMIGNDVKCIFNYDMDWIDINESRIIKSDWSFKDKLQQWLKKITDRHIIEHLINSVNYSWEKDLSWSNDSDKYSETWKEVIGSTILVPYENAGFWQEIVMKHPERYMVVPGSMINGLKEKFGTAIRAVGDVGEKSYSDKFRLIEEVSKRDQYILNECLQFLKEAEYDVKFPIKIVEFIRKETLGMAHEETIFLSTRLFEMGRKKTVAVIIEENEHIITNLDDETRDMQNHLFGRIVTLMEEKIGKFL